MNWNPQGREETERLHDAIREAFAVAVRAVGLTPDSLSLSATVQEGGAAKLIVEVVGRVKKGEGEDGS